ncbi:MAG: shikimate kinase [Deltaproteobacteria bacterium]|nr:shikimate kinase [Deltaproteobacteria bacterium]
MNIVLIGYRCSGKTTVGRLLARNLKRNFLDTDRLIEEKTGLPIHSYVSQNGWRDFRAVEKEIVEAIASRDASVIATGGGVVIDQENVRNLRKNGWVVWLDTDAPDIKDRMKGEGKAGRLRPSLSGVDPLDEIDQILNERTPFYEHARDYTVDTNGQAPEEVAQEIMMAFSRKHKNHREGQ